MKQNKKDAKVHKESQEHARQADYKKMETGPRPETFSARMPAYSYTVLCSEPVLTDMLVERKR